MWNLEKINKIKEQAQSEIDLIAEKYHTLLNEAIKAQIPKNCKLYTGMGHVSIKNSKGEHIAENFAKKLNNFNHNDIFNVNIYVENVNVD